MVACVICFLSLGKLFGVNNTNAEVPFYFLWVDMIGKEKATGSFLGFWIYVSLSKLFLVQGFLKKLCCTQMPRILTEINLT